MRKNTNLITSIAQAIGVLVMNGFDVEYDDNEYGVSVKIKCGGMFVDVLDANQEFERITVSTLVNKATDLKNKYKNSSESGSIVVSFDDALKLF